MDIFHCIVISSLLTLLVSSTTVSNTKLGQKGVFAEYPEFYQVSISLVKLSGIYKRSPDYENHILFEKRELHKNSKKDSECGCKCSNLTFRNHRSEIQGNCINPGRTGELWCYVDSSYANCSDLFPSIRFHHNPWSYEACKSPSSGSKPCPYDPAYSVLYVDGNGYWKIGQMFDGSMALISKSFESIYPPKKETWVQNTYGENEKAKHQKDIFVSVLPCTMDETLECVNQETAGFDWIICVSITVVVLVIVCVSVVFLRRRRSAMKTEPAVEMEKNEYYGHEDEYYNEHDNRMEDRNDYYQ